MTIMLSLLLFSLSVMAQHTPVTGEEEPIELTVYSWTSVSRPELHLSPDSKVELKGNAIIQQIDSFYLILPFDTNDITLTLIDDTIVRTLNLKPKPNEHFDPAWSLLDCSETPTPLTGEQYRAYSTYCKYRMLNQPVRNFLLETTEGHKLDSASLKGKITFLNFWYYGCLPCMAELPAINRLHDIYKNDDEVQVFSMFKDSIKIIATDSLLFETPSMLSSKKERYFYVNSKLTQVPNVEPYLSYFGVSGFPTNMVIDHDGIIRFILVGANSEGDNWHLTNVFANEINKLKQP